MSEHEDQAVDEAKRLRHDPDEQPGDDNVITEGIGEAPLEDEGIDLPVVVGHASRLHQKLAKVMAGVTRIEKRGHNPHFNYDYALAADVFDHLGRALGEQGITVIPTMDDVEDIQVPSRSGGGSTMTKVRVTFLFTDGETGEQIGVKWVGYGLDTQDKGPAKAMVAALKYMLLIAFLVPTGDLPDSDVDAPIREGEEGKPKQQRATRSAPTQRRSRGKAEEPAEAPEAPQGALESDPGALAAVPARPDPDEGKAATQQQIRAVLGLAKGAGITEDGLKTKLGFGSWKDLTHEFASVLITHFNKAPKKPLIAPKREHTSGASEAKPEPAPADAPAEGDAAAPSEDAPPPPDAAPAEPEAPLGSDAPGPLDQPAEAEPAPEAEPAAKDADAVEQDAVEALIASAPEPHNEMQWDRAVRKFKTVEKLNAESLAVFGTPARDLTKGQMAALITGATEKGQGTLA